MEPTSEGFKKSRPNHREFSPKDFLLAERILNEHAQQSTATNQHHAHEWKFYQKREGVSREHTKAIGDIAEAAVFSILHHERSPLQSLESMQVSVELASREDDILKGFDGVLKVSNNGWELAQIHYDATTNPTAVMRKIEEAVFYPKDASHTKVVLGFDIGSPDSPWSSIKDGSFSAPSFLLLVKEMEFQLQAHEAYAQKSGDKERAARCQRELLFVRYMLQRTPKAMPATLLQDRVFKAIEEAAREVAKTDPQSFRMGRSKAA